MILKTARVFFVKCGLSSSVLTWCSDNLDGDIIRKSLGNVIYIVCINKLSLDKSIHGWG